MQNAHGVQCRMKKRPFALSEGRRHRKFRFIVHSAWCTVPQLRCHYFSLVLDIVHEQILSPLRTILRVVTEKYVIEAQAKKLLRSEQRHTRLLRSSIAFTLIALYAGRHEILRRSFAALRTRQDVIERQVLSMLVLGTILTAIAVANIDPRTLHGRFAIVTPHMNVVTQPNDRWDGKCCRRRVQHVVAVIFLDKDRSAKPETHRACNTNRAERFV